MKCLPVPRPLFNMAPAELRIIRSSTLTFEFRRAPVAAARRCPGFGRRRT
jgi:hypothetical protein